MQVIVISEKMQEFNGLRYYLCGFYFQKKASVFIGKFGSFITQMKKFQKIIISIISTRIEKIISPKILSLFTKQNMARIICEPTRPEKDQEEICLKMSYQKASLGTGHRKAGMLQEELGLNTDNSILTKTDREELPTVWFARKNLSPGHMLSEDFVGIPAKCGIIGKIIGKLCEFTTAKEVFFAGIRDVYNLEVDGVHCFSINNGLVVHNCRYGVVSLRDVPKSIISPHLSNYEKIFGSQRDDTGPISHLPQSGRGGYGLIWIFGFILWGVINAIQAIC